MSGQENLDLGRVIGLIMENPALVEQISNLAKQSTADSKEPSAVDTAEEKLPRNEVVEERVTPTYSPVSSQKSNRAQLLGALKPYLSEERAKAIDSMISISEVLGMMKGR